MATYVAVNLLKQQKFQPNLLLRQFKSGIIVFNQESGISPPTYKSTAGSTIINENVPGLSEAVVKTEEPVGPGASKTGDYKCPEYFNYNNTSYFEAEIEMLKYRCPQPNAQNHLY